MITPDPAGLREALREAVTEWRQNRARLATDTGREEK